MRADLRRWFLGTRKIFRNVENNLNSVKKRQTTWFCKGKDGRTKSLPVERHSHHVSGRVSERRRAKQRKKNATGDSPPSLRRKREEAGGDLNLERRGGRRETEGGKPPPAGNRLRSRIRCVGRGSLFCCRFIIISYIPLNNCRI
jgi:hypothetical protein